MGDLAVKSIQSTEQKWAFLSHLLKDVEALDIMLKNDQFEKAPLRIGAEQELAVIDENYMPSYLGPDILVASEDPHLTSEIARFNLEINLDPFELRDKAFSQTEAHLHQLLQTTKDLTNTFEQKILLTGILPTIQREHLDRRFMTPLERYRLLSEMMHHMRGDNFEIHILGVDELLTSLDSVLFEACNTSFQMHLQIPANEFVDQYNWAQQIAGPVLSISNNSPILLGRELWMETRIALFRQSLDTRTSRNHQRDKQARVFFGNHWLRNSVAGLFKEQIARFPLLLAKDITEDSLADLEAGKVPALRALRVHNGTVYTWNRPCYGRSTNLPHLRIENRYIPSGPTVKDEIANFAFWVGIMKGMPEKYEDFYQRISFAPAKDNFYRAARTGLHSVFCWFGKHYSGPKLILEKLLPMAYEGLNRCGIDQEDIDQYLQIIEKRALAETTGSLWQIKNYRALRDCYGIDIALKQLTKSMYELQQEGQPLHEWPALLPAKTYVVPKAGQSIGAIMHTDLFTVDRDEPLSLVRAIMEWHSIRHLPVEDQEGNLVGIITAKDLIRITNQELPEEELFVKDVMIKTLHTADKEMSIEDGIHLMKTYCIGCLPVVREGKLMGLITDTDLRNLGLW